MGLLLSSASKILSHSKFAENGVFGFGAAAADRDDIREILQNAEEQKFDIPMVIIFDYLRWRDHPLKRITEPMRP